MSFCICSIFDLIVNSICLHCFKLNSIQYKWNSFLVTSLLFNFMWNVRNQAISVFFSSEILLKISFDLHFSDFRIATSELRVFFFKKIYEELDNDRINHCFRCCNLFIMRDEWEKYVNNKNHTYHIPYSMENGILHIYNKYGKRQTMPTWPTHQKHIMKMT